MSLLRFWMLVAALSCFVRAQDAATSPPRSRLNVAGSAANVTEPSVRPDREHYFWDRENIYLFSAVALMRGLDYASTRNFQARGRQEILLPDDVVNNSAGFAALEAAGTATSIGVSYAFHRTGHHKLERWVSIGHISVAGFGDTRNYLLHSHHSATTN